MKRLLQFLLASVFLLSACSKEKSTEFNDNDPGTGGPGTGGPGTGGGAGGYYLRCKIDGVAKNYSAFVIAQKINGGSGVSVSVSGSLVANGTSFEGMGLQINTNVPLTTGTYSDDAGGTDYALGAVFNPNSQTIVYGNLTMSPTDPLKIVITSLSNTEIAGTFKGTLYQVDIQNPQQPNPPTKVVSEGEFKAKFQ